MNLITGATGLVGAHLALHLLEKGLPVRALYRSESRREQTLGFFRLYQKEELFTQIEWFLADICDIPSLEPAFSGATRVWHCAGLISYDPDDEENMRKINIEGTANIVNLCLDFGVEKLCHVSSVAALGDPLVWSDPIDEETEWNPERSHSDYAISKYGAEMEVWRGRQEGLSVLIFAPGVILGPVPDLNTTIQGSAQIFKEIKKGFPFYTQGASGFISVTDLTRIMSELMNSEVENQRFVMVSENRNIRDLAKQIALAYQVRPPHIEAGKNLLRIAVCMDWLGSFFGRKRRLFSESIPALLAKSVFSDAKLRSVIHPGYTNLDAYVKECVVLMGK